MAVQHIPLFNIKQCLGEVLVTWMMLRAMYKKIVVQHHKTRIYVAFELILFMLVIQSNLTHFGLLIYAGIKFGTCLHAISTILKEVYTINYACLVSLTNSPEALQIVAVVFAYKDQLQRPGNVFKKIADQHRRAKLLKD